MVIKKTDDILVEEFLKGDNEAFDDLCNRYENLIKKEVSKFNGFCRTSDEKDDLYQIAKIVFAYVIKNYDKSYNSSLGIMYKIFLRRHLCNYVRRHSCYKRRTNIETLSLDANMSISNKELNFFEAFISDVNVKYDPMKKVDLKNSIEELVSFLDGFDEIDKQIFIRKIKGYTYAEIASALNIRKKKVDNTMRKIRKKLKDSSEYK